ncbi:hypothetical protein EWB00_007513 [Schistosoma japonicum]|uniref:Uncharacterized protein n=1 Tax=Schistosoma japonicum TaxID=6182 RepID=A0A4Z2CUR9_SCHJA|nr:hypothetical protein EWB00_007513 [Schistosoma japonicum]
MKNSGLLFQLLQHSSLSDSSISDLFKCMSYSRITRLLHSIKPLPKSELFFSSQVSSRCESIKIALFPPTIFMHFQPHT